MKKDPLSTTGPRFITEIVPILGVLFTTRLRTIPLMGCQEFKR